MNDILQGLPSVAVLVYVFGMTLVIALALIFLLSIRSEGSCAVYAQDKGVGGKD